MKKETIASFHLGNSYDENSQFLFCIRGPIITKDMVIKALKSYYRKSNKELKELLSDEWNNCSDENIKGMFCSMVGPFGPLTIRTEILYSFD
jgi:hypothetical protein